VFIWHYIGVVEKGVTFWATLYTYVDQSLRDLIIFNVSERSTKTTF